jgi:hypothetical protein
VGRLHHGVGHDRLAAGRRLAAWTLLLHAVFGFILGSLARGRLAGAR